MMLASARKVDDGLKNAMIPTITQSTPKPAWKSFHPVVEPPTIMNSLIP